MSKRSETDVPPAVTAAVPERGRFADEDATRAWGWGQGMPPRAPYVPPPMPSAAEPLRVRLAGGVEVTLDATVAEEHPELVAALREALRHVMHPDRKLRIVTRK